MEATRSAPAIHRIQSWLVILATAWVLLPPPADAQGLSGALVGTVKDEQGAVTPGALVRVISPALIGGPATTTTNEKGQWRFPVLLPGTYVLDIELPGFAPHHQPDIQIGAGATLERTVVLQVAGIAQSVVVQDSGSRIEARRSGSKRDSDPSTSEPSPHDGSACLIRSGPRLVCHPPRRQAAR